MVGVVVAVVVVVLDDVVVFFRVVLVVELTVTGGAVTGVVGTSDTAAT